MLVTEVIKHKRSGANLSPEQLKFFIEGYTEGSIPDYQMASLLMAIFLKGMNSTEIVHLTRCMIESGTQVKFENMFPVDKHSTGGVGDKTSLILAPIVAACGVPVPMMSGRGLGHTGGTLDKLESIPGFNVNLDLETFKKQVDQLQLCFIGQTKDICPADKKIYALRDVTGTVESLPLICASIMSKKIAEGINGLVLDVKCGSGAFMKTFEDAKSLAQGLISIGEGYGLKTEALITDMNQPLGKFVGNSLEIGECISILKRQDFMGNSYKEFSDTELLSLELSAKMISIGLKCNYDEAMNKAKEALDSGKAYEKFEEVCKIQNGNLDQLPLPTEKIEIKAESSGFLSSINSERVGVAGISVQAGRKIITDQINPVTGIEVHKKISDEIQTGDLVFTLHLDPTKNGAEDAEMILKNCFDIADQAPETHPLILERL